MSTPNQSHEFLHVTRDAGKWGVEKVWKRTDTLYHCIFPSNERERELSAFQEHERGQERKGGGIMEHRGRKKGRTLEEAEKQGQTRHKIEEG